MEITFEKIAILPLALLGLGFAGYKLHQNRQRRHIPALPKLLISALMCTLVCAAAVINPITWWSHVASIVCLHYCLVAHYHGIDQLINIKAYQPLLKTKLFLSTTFVALIITRLSFQLDPNFQPFVDGNAYQPTPTYYFEQLLNYAWLLFLFLLTVKLYWENMRKHREFSYIIRRLLCLVGFAVAVICVLLTILNLLLSICLGQDTYGQSINLFCQSAKPLSFYPCRHRLYVTPTPATKNYPAF